MPSQPAGKPASGLSHAARKRSAFRSDRGGRAIAIPRLVRKTDADEMEETGIKMTSNRPIETFTQPFAG